MDFSRVAKKASRLLKGNHGSLSPYRFLSAARPPAMGSTDPLDRQRKRSFGALRRRTPVGSESGISFGASALARGDGFDARASGSRKFQRHSSRRQSTASPSPFETMRPYPENDLRETSARLRRSLGLEKAPRGIFFCAIHALIKQDHPNPQEVGQIRSRQNWIGPEGAPREDAYFLPPPPGKVLPLLRNLESYLKEDSPDPLVQLAIGFAQFLVIHPFMDGNGRVSQSLGSLLRGETKAALLSGLVHERVF